MFTNEIPYSTMACSRVSSSFVFAQHKRTRVKKFVKSRENATMFYSKKSLTSTDEREKKRDGDVASAAAVVSPR